MSTLKVNSIQPLSSTGAVTIGGSVVVSGSETFNNIGPSKFVGNLIVSNGSITGSNVVNINGQASEFSLANGQYITASGQFSHAEGLQTLASGNYSHAEGRLTQAIGNYSHAEGFGTIAAAPYQHVQGKFNQTSSVQTAFIIGNGSGVGSESNLVFADDSSFQISGSLNVSGSDHSIQGLLTSSQTNIVTINPSTGVLSYTPSLIESVSLNISCSNTSSATTTILNYGVNVIVLSTPSNYACKLPQPVTGRKVTVVNNSTLGIYLYPSNIGGQINNYPINTPAIIPPDGNSYDFVCIENPLPGAWVWSPPAIGQYDSGEIAVTTTTDSFNSFIAAASWGGTIYAAERNGLTSINAFNGLNRPPVIQTTPGAMPNTSYFALLKPPTIWNAITKIKVYSNIVPEIGDTPTFTLTGGCQINYYNAGTQTFISQGVGSTENPFLDNSILLTNTIFSASPVSPGLTTNIGDPGTVWGETALTPDMFNLPPDPLLQYLSIGDKFISTDGIEDTWFTRWITSNFKHRVIGNVKFRFFFEYY